MAITRRTIRLSNELRIVIGGVVNVATRQLVEAWARAWEQIEAEWQTAIEDLIAVGDGRWPTRAQIRRATRAQHALQIATREVVQLADLTGVVVVTSLQDAVGPTAEWQARIIASQLPPSLDQATLIAHFDRVDPDALGAIVERTTERIHALTRPLSRDAVEAMRAALVRGVAVGDNPRTAARAMLNRVQGAFNGGLTRAMTIVSTEILDAHRSAAAASHFANADVLRGWVWTAQLDERTCSSCWSKHGNEFPLEVTGPDDHQRGRCARVPVTKSWYELGLNIPEPPSVMRDARTVFDALPQTKRLAIMGPVRLRALDTGSMPWRDLSVRRSTDGWRDSYAPSTVGYARRRLMHPAP